MKLYKRNNSSSEQRHTMGRACCCRDQCCINIPGCSCYCVSVWCKGSARWLLHWRIHVGYLLALLVLGSVHSTVSLVPQHALRLSCPVELGRGGPQQQAVLPTHPRAGVAIGVVSIEVLQSLLGASPKRDV